MRYRNAAGEIGGLRHVKPKNVSMIANPTDEQLAEQGMMRVAEQPSFDPSAKKVETIDGVEVDGEWVTWQIVDLTTDELNTRLQSEITQRTQQRLDQAAQAHGYDNILSACTYNLSAVTRFAQEGQYCIALRDSTWAALDQLLKDVEAGNRAAPSGFEEIEPELPVIDWPE